MPRAATGDWRRNSENWAMANTHMKDVNDWVAVKAMMEKTSPRKLLAAQTRLAFLSVGPSQSRRKPPAILPATPVATVTPPNARSAVVGWWDNV